MSNIEEIIRRCAGMTDSELLPVIPSIIIPRPPLEEILKVLGSYDPVILKGVFKAATVCDRGSRPILRSEIIQHWLPEFERNMTLVLNSLISSLDRYVTDHLEDGPALRLYISDADDDECAESLLRRFCPGHMTAKRYTKSGLTKMEAWLFCRDMRFCLKGEEILFLATIDQKLDLGFTYKSGDQTLIPISS